MTFPFDDELRGLWSRRATLDEAGWNRLYHIVYSVLAQYRPQHLAALPDDLAVYIHSFFVDKVYRFDLLNECYHAGALKVFFKNYLFDELRTIARRSAHEVSASETSEDGRNLDSDSKPDVATEQLVELDSLDALAQMGLHPEAVSALARQWLHAQEEWVRLFLALSNCPDAEESEALSRLAARYRIKSQAYKAAQLGFNWREPTYVGFGKTLIGQWIASLGIAIAPENQQPILAALKILCFEALSWADRFGK